MLIQKIFLFIYTNFRINYSNILFLSVFKSIYVYLHPTTRSLSPVASTTPSSKRPPVNCSSSPSRPSTNGIRRPPMPSSGARNSTRNAVPFSPTNSATTPASWPSGPSSRCWPTPTRSNSVTFPVRTSAIHRGTSSSAHSNSNRRSSPLRSICRWTMPGAFCGASSICA